MDTLKLGVGEGGSEGCLRVSDFCFHDDDNDTMTSLIDYDLALTLCSNFVCFYLIS